MIQWKGVCFEVNRYGMGGLESLSGFLISEEKRKISEDSQMNTNREKQKKWKEKGNIHVILSWKDLLGEDG